MNTTRPVGSSLDGETITTLANRAGLFGGAMLGATISVRITAFAHAIAAHVRDPLAPAETPVRIGKCISGYARARLRKTPT